MISKSRGLVLVSTSAVARLFPQIRALSSLPKALRLDLAERLIITVLYAYFVINVVRSFYQAPSLITVLLLLSETLPLILVLIRRPSATLSIRPLDWLFGFAGTTAPLLVSPVLGSSLAPQVVCVAIIIAGIFVQVSAKVALGLSFGIVAANRGVKVSGPYRFIRHPMYAGYEITHVGLLLAMPSLLNAVIYASTLALQIARILREERVLSQDQQYLDFSTRVQYRLLPGLF